MYLKNCDRCGKAYKGSNPELCPDCIGAIEDDFKKVREFIKDNPKVSLELVVEKTGVDEKTIRAFLRQGRLDLVEHLGPVLECRKCGKPIYTGDYCLVCASEIKGTFRSSSTSTSGRPSQSQHTDRERERMAFARRYRKR